MLKNARVAALTISELLRENRQRVAEKECVEIEDQGMAQNRGKNTQKGYY